MRTQSKPQHIVIKLALGFVLFGLLFFLFNNHQKDKLPIVAIANFGPHETLENSIKGLKASLAKQGFKENEQIHFEISDANFEPFLIDQMLTKLKATKPQVMVVITTPVAQNAKNTIKDIPLVYSVVTDPFAAGLLQDPLQPHQNMTGSSDKQNVDLFLEFAKKLYPNTKTVGLLYTNNEANDAILLQMMQKACEKANMALLPSAIDHPRDIPFRMQTFKNKADIIYIGGSGAIQPATPAIAAIAKEMRIPLFNATSESVKANLVLSSFGVDYFQVGVNAGNIVARILQGEKIANIAPIYPQKEDHSGYISKKLAKEYHLTLSPQLENTTLVE